MSSGELYTGFFGLNERPFTLIPDPSFLYWSTQHQRAFSVLEFGIMSRAPITLVTGEIGAGKTTLVQKLLSKVDDGQVSIGLISNAQGGRGELLQWVLNALSVPFVQGESYVSMFQRFQEFMISEYAAGRRVVLIIDEAQNLSSEGLEELRMLTNINSNKDELIQLILVGQPELRDMVRSPSMRQLAQRVAASFHLDKMDQKTVTKYISHRMETAGGTGKEFTSGACKAIFQATQGVPRLVNQLCEFALMYAWSDETNVVSLRVVKSVLKDGVFFGGFALESDEDEIKDDEKSTAEKEKDNSELLFLRSSDRIIPEGQTG
ncbi:MULTISPECIES: ExeA family protein [unclassified Ruegeria]|uniref:ExeA family protein n=2 Tax=unclassified Ruegeria TaxID=2625375 RepID=UPI001489F399|nr:AAA family ATPase [Ruegeria sp. HKCCD7255]